MPFGNVTILDGEPGLGKSTLAVELAARLTTGRGVPGGPDLPAAAALIATCEDGVRDTLTPRARAAGADLGRLRLLDEVEEGCGATRPVQLPDDLKLIEARMAQTGARLLVIDPLMGFLGRDRLGRPIDSARDQSVRMLMAELRALAGRLRAAVVLVRHLNKTQNVGVIYRGSGSIGISGAARSVLLLGRHPDDPEAGRVVASTKSNLGPRPLSRVWRFAPDTGAVEWGEECGVTADDLAAFVGRPEARRVTPSQWLRARLADGRPHPAAGLIAAARAAGYTDRQLVNARRILGASSVKAGGGYVWQAAG